MKINLIKIPAYEVLEIQRDNLYEYYVKPYDYPNFIYAFGTEDRFTPKQLQVLADNCYFEDIED